jgi:3-methyladenine DNA glycosylase AlkC
MARGKAESPRHFFGGKAMAEITNDAHRRLLRYFEFAHLPEHLQAISQPMCQLAIELAATLANSKDPAEVTTGLRKLLEAKDCFVRAKLS